MAKREKTSDEERVELIRKLAKEGRLGQWVTPGLVLKAITPLILVVLTLVFRDPITSFVASQLLNFKGLISNQTQATIVANYLLFALILVTILVEPMSYYISWFNRPKIALLSIDHGRSGYLRVKRGNQPEERIGVSIIYAGLWNTGRSPAIRPVLNVSHTDYRIGSLLPAKTEASWADRQITILPANIYQFNGDYEELAVQFIKKGMKPVEYIPGRTDGKRIILGFGFEGGEYFYFASLDSAFVDKVKLGDAKQRISLNFHARNSPKKILRTNIPATFESWNKVKFDYRAIEETAPR